MKTSRPYRWRFTQAKGWGLSLLDPRLAPPELGSNKGRLQIVGHQADKHLPVFDKRQQGRVVA